MNRLSISLMILVCLLFAACDKDDIASPPIDWTWDILTPESVKYEGSSPGWSRSVYFKADGREGDVVITCKNYHTLGFADTSLDVYDFGWATLRIEADKIKIHFPQYFLTSSLFDCRGTHMLDISVLAQCVGDLG